MAAVHVRNAYQLASFPSLKFFRPESKDRVASQFQCSIGAAIVA